VGGGKGGSFQKMIAVLDTAQVTQIKVVAPKAEQAVTMTRQGSAWQLTPEGGQTVNADPKTVNAALGEIAKLEATQLVAKSSDSWAEYQVDDETGTRVTVTGGDELLDVVVGRFEYKQLSGGMTSYIRRVDEDDVYLVKGFLDASFNKEVDGWRNKTILNGSSNDWQNITFSYPDGAFQLFKGNDNIWRMPDSTEADQGKVSAYLSAISNLNGTTFAETKPAGAPLARVEVAQGDGKAYSINAYPQDTTFGINSTYNPDSYFNGADGDIYNKVFVPKTQFFPILGEEEIR